jgi:hypothetical protein
MAKHSARKEEQEYDTQITCWRRTGSAVLRDSRIWGDSFFGCWGPGGDAGATKSTPAESTETSNAESTQVPNAESAARGSDGKPANSSTDSCAA